MDEVLSFKRGRVPLLISMPHPGTRLTPAVDAGLVEEARALTDTDWHIPRLYDFAEELGASTLAAHYSRYVVDLNRSSDDKPLYSTATTGLYPDTLFDGRPLYREGMAPSAEERMRYLAEVWTPYHRTIAEELARLKAEFGYALLWDAHSIRSHVPHLFDGRLPDFNLGTNAGASCDPALAARLEAVCAAAEGYSHVLNGRFKGGHITRHYGQPEQHVHAVQLELRSAPTWTSRPRSLTARTSPKRPARSSANCWKASSPGGTSATPEALGGGGRLARPGGRECRGWGGASASAFWKFSVTNLLRSALMRPGGRVRKELHNCSPLSSRPAFPSRGRRRVAPGTEYARNARLRFQEDSECSPSPTRRTSAFASKTSGTTSRYSPSAVAKPSASPFASTLS